MTPPIRRGDGTPLAPSGIAQVRAGDGDVYYERNVIPDSGADHQYNYEEGSGTTVSDVNGSVDYSFNSLDWGDDGDGAGGTYGKFDGSMSADIAASNYTHFLQQEGTWFSWLYINSGTGDNMPIGTNFTSSGNQIAHLIDLENSRYDPILTIDGNFHRIQAGTPPTDEWFANALVADGTDFILYEATAANNYSISEVGSETLSGSVDQDFSTRIGIAHEENAGRWNVNGRMDYQFVDSTGFSSSELQSIVDDTKGYYQ